MLDSDMSTLGQIEAAVEALPLPQQQQLLAHLQTRLAVTASNQPDRETWLRRLAELRARTKPAGASVQEVLDDIRAERF